MAAVVRWWLVRDASLRECNEFSWFGELIALICNIVGSRKDRYVTGRKNRID